MTDRISGSDERRCTSAEEASRDLQERIKLATELESLLSLFGEEIEKLALVDGYLINLRDSETKHLISLKVRLTPEFRALEDTYHRYKVALSGDALNLNARAFHSRGIVQCGIRDGNYNGSETERNLLKLWKLQEIAAIAMLDEDDFSQAPIGTLLLLKQDGQIDEPTFVAIEQLISAFYKPLRHALENSFRQERCDRIEAAVSEQSRIQQFVVEMNHAASLDSICHVFSTEMFRQYAFDGLGLFLLEGDALINRHVEAADPCYHQVSSAWEEYLRDTPYLLDATDGGISHAFLKNLPLIFHDVQTIIDLPMSEKDHQSLTILKTARTFLLVPVCHAQTPIGVLAFYSLLDPVNISESDLRVINRLTSAFAGAVTRICESRTTGNRLLN